ncbi:tyrosine-type recombinase/integrase [Kribbella sp. NBC_00889]|uniref:tyrosine-type recombinase/integrase n=1 Tax=Kribbella sp. NBC_00889 TaxID=2975974 RepID=UPI00386D177C|nr:site-specific integrase [Kribbella sp. NBC_00889]
MLIYSGVDPVTGKPVYLSESTTDEAKVNEIQTRLQAKVDRQRNAATKATLEYALSEWLEVHEADESTLDRYRELVDRTIVPALGDVPISKIGTRALEKFYAQLRRCRVRCNGKPYIEHRVAGEHDCRVVQHRRPPGRPSAKSRAEHDCTSAGCNVVECQPHVCKPLAAGTVRKIHFVISGALAAAVRWDWIDSNPAADAKKPKQAPPQPQPPTTDEGNRIVTAAWGQDLAWGMLIWLKMVTGARRGELLALRWHDVHLDQGVLEIRRNFTRRNGKAREKDTKTHQMRRISLDPDTVELLTAHRSECERRFKQLGVTFKPTAFVFSYEADHSKPCNPDGISHRYAKMCADLGIKSHLHTLRHYSATELISSGVDIRTVAGRLGHGGGGTTTLRVYAAWVADSDKQAANLLGSRMPRPGGSTDD